MKKYAFVLTCLMASSVFAAPETKEFDAQGLKEVSVENMAGKVVITTTEGAKASVSATKVKFTDKCKMTMDRTGNELKIKVEKSLMSTADCSVDFEIKVPKTVDVEATVGAGELSVNGTQGKLEYKVGAGDVSADGTFSKVEGKSGTGKVTIKGLTGGGEFKSGAGTIDLTYAKSPLKGELAIKSGSTDATIAFPKGTQLKTEFKVASGQVKNELGETAKAPFSVSMKAGTGSLHIKSY